MKYAAIALFVLALVLAGCVAGQSINSIKSEGNIGKTVVVSGTVANVVSIGGLSFYNLEDDSGSIPVSSRRLPAKGDQITANGTLMKDTLVGYYIKVIE
jgi:aspartyl-tRNA synthetase